MIAEVPKTLTTGEASRALSIPEWRLISLFRRGLIPEPDRLGQNRMLTPVDVERARTVLARLGVLPAPAEPEVSA